MDKMVLILCFVAATHAPAADTRKYAAMSLLGDQIEIVYATPQTGSTVSPRNVHEKVPMPDTTLDKTALRAVDRSVATRLNGEKLTPLLASVVDMTTLKVLREDVGLASSARSAARAPDGADPWQALDDNGKVRMLEGLLEMEIARVLPPLLKE